MTLALQAAPLLVLLGLLASGRAGPLLACGLALLAALPGIALAIEGPLPAFLAGETPRAAWLALQPIAVMSGGLLFHAAVQREGAAGTREATPARVFAATLPLGAFLESVTGFAVGAVFALAALRRMEVRGPVAVALAMQALVLVPWGGLGPGSALGAALVGLPAQPLLALAAWPNAVWVMALGPVLWSLMRRAGLHVTPREAAVQLGLLALIAVGLVGWHAVLPFEVVGVVATGPVAAWALWRADPPRSWREALAVSWPYLLLTACLLAARAVPGVPALRPFEGLPGFGLTHVAVVLWAVSLGLLAMRGGLAGRAGTALRRAGRPAAAMLLYVILGRWLAGSGVAAALAGGLIAGKGALAAFALVPIGFLSGFVTGSNVGANASLMPVQAALGEALGWPPLLAPALHNFSGAAGAGMAIAGTAMLCALQGEGTRPGQVWRLLWPSMALVMGIGTGTMWLWR